MTSLLLLLSQLSLSQPMDTGVRLGGCLEYRTARHLLVVRIWNASPHPVSTLSLRLHLNGSPPSFEGMGWRVMIAERIGVDGMPIDGYLGVPHQKQAPTPARPGCSQDTCSHSVDLPLGSVSVSPLEGLRLELWPAELVDGIVDEDELEPSRPPNRRDWSFSNLDSASGCGGVLFSGGLSRATRIELRSGGKKLWGNAPGESYERPNWPLTDFSAASFSSLMHVQSDTIPVAERDRRNSRPARWLVNQAGYRLSDVKAGKARVMGVAASSWKLIDSKGGVRGTGTAPPSGGRISGYLHCARYDARSLKQVFDSTARICAGEMSEFVLPTHLTASDGPYRVVSDEDSSAPFSIDADIYGMLRDASLRFFGVQRSGNSSSWLRPSAFADDPVAGGWYDCGGHMKDGLTISYAMEVLGALAAIHPDRDPDRTSWLQSLEKPDNVPDMVRELRHGADFALASWELSGKDPANMVTTVGNFVADSYGWTHDTWLPIAPASHGGPGSRIVQKGMGGNIAGGWAAGLAFAARLHAKSDPVFAARAMEAARGLYRWGKANPMAKHGYIRNDYESSSELALAAVALLWATRDSSYLYDLTSNDSIAKNKWPTLWYASGGWLGTLGGVALGLNGEPLAIDNPSPLALYSFLRLILADSDSASRYGVDPTRYESLRDLAMHGVLRQLGTVSSVMGNTEIVLPGDTLRFDGLWKFPRFGRNTGSTGEQSGIYALMLLYADLARTFQDRPTKQFPAGTRFQADSIESIAVRGMDFLLGQNPWNVSFLMGIGSRNMNHIHHALANPEGGGLSALDWPYRAPVGGLIRGPAHTDSFLIDDWRNINTTNACLDYSANFLVSSTLLAQPASSGATGRFSKPPRERSPHLEWNAGSRVLRWSDAPAGLQWVILDVRGRVVGEGRTAANSGHTFLDVPPGVMSLRWQSRGTQGSMTLLGMHK